METQAFKTHMIYVDYPMNSLNLKEMEDDIIFYIRIYFKAVTAERIEECLTLRKILL